MQRFTPSQSVSNVNALTGWAMNEIPSTSSQLPVAVASSLSVPPHQGIIGLIFNCVRCFLLGWKL